MQSINLKRKFASTSTTDQVNEQWKQAFALEQSQDEIEILREQIASLQQHLSELLWQQDLVEQELHHVKQEMQQMNTENQQLVEEKLIFIQEMKEFARTLSSHNQTDKRALMKLLNRFCENIAPSEKLGLVKLSRITQQRHLV
jgi:uncharacterized protein (DUF3084 family)